MVRLQVWLPVLAGVGAMACAQEPDPPPCIEPVAIDPAGVQTVWVVDSVQMPTSATEANQLGLNLDCDAQERPDNEFGRLLAGILGLWTNDVNGDVAAMIEAGRLLHLFDIRATSLIAAERVGMTVLHGLDLDGEPRDNFSGGEAFGIDTSRGRGTVAGRVDSSHLSARGGQLPIGFTLPSLDEVIVLPIEGARVEVDIVWDGTLAGKISGGIPDQAVQLILVPVFADALGRLVDGDCAGTTTGQPPCGCAVDSRGQTLLELFDEQPDRPGTESDGDCVITTDELRDNSLARSLLAPDIDLFDADGELAPRADGVKDSLSIGIGFTAVPARLDN